ncbi:oxygen-insensitive NAD(P)H nitroreductase [Novosphingobium sp. 9]|uniref:oxygen-insensitive NAD(P)H nitroreductase n=1 Tax=Novosphingobium sp. 9 TaxID=2025349 RepID=UPI0021B5679C|nr:oxygen-insensitive NAD(P)H nitroreductase [Novosphingobium sp. 9]
MTLQTAVLPEAAEVILEAARSRYTTKAYDPSRRIADADVEKIKELLQLTPSSVNSQPWHFVIAGTEDGKARVAKGVEGQYAFNLEKVTKASHVVVFASRLAEDDEYVLRVTDVEDAAGRYANAEAREGNLKGRRFFVGWHRDDLKDLRQWADKQVYIAIGQLLLGAAAMGIDATPMEGIDTAVLDRELGLPEKGFTAICAVALGYRAEDDFNAKLPKARLPLSEVITEI